MGLGSNYIEIPVSNEDGRRVAEYVEQIADRLGFKGTQAFAAKHNRRNEEIVTVAPPKDDADVALNLASALGEKLKRTVAPVGSRPILVPGQ